MLFLSSGFPPSHYINADCIPYAMLSIPVAIYQLLICTSLTHNPFLPASKPSFPSGLKQIALYICESIFD